MASFSVNHPKWGFWNSESDNQPFSCFDYGPVPFRFYHYWLTLDGFDKFVKVTWREAPGDKVNALRNLMFKLKYLKVRIREWVSNKRYHSQAKSNRLKADLAKLDDSIDKGMGTIDIVNKRTETLNSLHKLNYLQSTEAAQKAKVKWSVEGDKNVRFFSWDDQQKTKKEKWTNTPYSVD
ncbi:hypothetical protein Tco_0605750 [Tanacetum coccineum]